MRLILTVLLVAFLGGCREAPDDPAVSYPEEATVLSVEGMHCSGCRAKIVRSLAKVEGVEWAQVEYEVGEVAFGGSAELPAVIAAIEEAGYGVRD